MATPKTRGIRPTHDAFREDSPMEGIFQRIGLEPVGF